MATNTTNFNLKKPAYTDTADIADINGNMDKVDVSLNGLADAIAIVANNNTHAAITTGQYVYVHGHGSLAEGLYTAKSNIAANATLSTSNLQADGSGGLNSVYASLNSKRTWTKLTGIEENTNFDLTTDCNEVMAACYFASGQAITFRMGIPTSGTIRQDMGFYYTDSANGSGAATVNAGRVLKILHPFYNKAETTFSSIDVYVR